MTRPSRRPFPTTAVFAVLALLSSASCASFGVWATTGSNAALGQTDAEAALKEGDAELEGGNFVEAQRAYDHVRSKFPYSDAAITAELRIADVDFGKEHYIEARDRYQSFIKLHPTHPKVDYAAFRAALTWAKDMPSEFFIFPPAPEKDQGNVRGAGAAMGEFLRQYPNSPHAAEAKSIYNDVRRRLAEHELYAAAFYARRDKWAAVASRLTNVTSKYGDLPMAEGAWLDLYDAYVKLNDPEKAKATLEECVKKIPESNSAQRAKKLLGRGG